MNWLFERLSQMRGCSPECLENARTNFTSWLNIVGWTPCHGMWRYYRYRARTKAFFFGLAILLSLTTLLQADTWSLSSNETYVSCAYPDSSERQQSRITIPNDVPLPAMAECELRHATNFGPIIAILYLIGALIYVGRLSVSDPDNRGVSIFRPEDEQDDVLVRYALHVHWPEALRVKKDVVKGMDHDATNDALVDKMSDHVSVKIVPFYEDVVSVAGVSVPVMPLPALMSQALDGWAVFLSEMAKPYYTFNDPDHDDPEEELDHHREEQR